MTDPVLPPIPLHFCRPRGDTFEEMRKSAWDSGLAQMGDAVLIWVNEGDLCHLLINGGATELPQAPLSNGDPK